MKCDKCGRELRIGTERVGADANGLPVFRRFGYCDYCKIKWDIDAMAQQHANQYRQMSQQNNCGNSQGWHQVNRSNTPNKSLFWEKTWFIVLMSIFLPPVGLILLWATKKPKNMTARIALTALLSFYFFAGIVGTATDMKENKSNRQTTVEKPEKEEAKKEKESNDNKIDDDKRKDRRNSFVEEMKEFSGENTANGAYDVLVEKIGFSDVEFEEQIGGSSNYKIIADGIGMVITAMEDYYRVFIPDTSYVFYEDGEIVLTAKEFNDSRISNADMPYYYTIAQTIVEDYLKSPKSADFPSSSEIAYQKKDNLVAIKGYVDAENSFGAEIRGNYIVQFYVYDLENFSYETTYIEIDGEKTGEFIAME